MTIPDWNSSFDFTTNVQSQDAVLPNLENIERTDNCIQQLSNRTRNTYKKGVIDAQLEIKLFENLTKACERAKELILFNNPSSNMNIFIEELENVKKTI